MEEKQSINNLETVETNTGTSDHSDESKDGSNLLNSSKKIKKTKPQLRNDISKVTSISGIHILSNEDQKKYKRKFVTVVNYRLKEDQRDRRKTIKFGKLIYPDELQKNEEPKYEDFIFTKNEEERTKLFYRSNHNALHPLNPRWWRVYALNTASNMKESYENIVKILQDKWGLTSYQVNLKIDEY